MFFIKLLSSNAPNLYIMESLNIINITLLYNMVSCPTTVNQILYVEIRLPAGLRHWWGMTCSSNGTPTVTFPGPRSYELKNMVVRYLIYHVIIKSDYTNWSSMVV